MKNNPVDIHQIFNTLPGSYLVLAPDVPKFTIITATDSYLRITGTKREDIVGRGVFEVFPDNSEENVVKSRKTLTESFTCVVEQKKTDATGIQRYDIQTAESGNGEFAVKFWNVVNYPVLGPDGNVSCIINQVEDVTESVLRKEKETEQQEFFVSLKESRAAALNLLQDAVAAREKAEQASEKLLREITERKKIEEALKESEATFHLAQQASGVGTWDWNIITGTVKWTPELFTVFGLDADKDEANFETWERIMHPDDKAAANERIEIALREHKPLESSYRIILPDGQIRWIRSSGEGRYDNEGNAVRMLGICQDITKIQLSEEALRISEEQYRNLFNTMIEGFCIIELVFNEDNKAVDYRILEINPAFETQTGLKNVKGKLISEVIPDNEDYWYQFYGEIALSGVPARIEDEVKGLNHWYEVFAYRVGGEGSRKVAILFNDITDRKKVEIQIRNEARRAQLLSELTKYFTEAGFNQADLFDTIAAKVAEFIGDICIITKMSPDEQWLYPVSFYHPDPEAIETLRSIFPNVPIRVGSGNVGKVALTGKPVKVTGVSVESIKQSVKPEYWTYLDRFGLHDYLIVPLKTEGKVIGTLGVIRLTSGKSFSEEDQGFLEIVASRAAMAITNIRLYEELQLSHRDLEEKVAERTSELSKTLAVLSSEQARFREVLDMLPSYVALLTPDYEFSFVNREFIRRFGDAGRVKCYKHLFNREEPCEVCNSYDVFRKNRSVFWEWEGPDGCIYDIKDFPFTDTDGSQLILEIGTDISKIKQAETDRIARQVAEQANLVKSEFLANISHEIRTPMNAIIGFSDLLITTIEDDKQRSQLGVIRSSSKSLLNLINDILDLSKIEAGKMKIQPEPVYFHSIISEIEKVFVQKAGEKGIRFFVENEKAVPALLMLDETRLRQILFNLVDNAIKFTEQGHVILIIDRIMKGQNKLDLVISVEDTGIGIPADQYEHIFNAFSQLKALPQKKHIGTGLGLTITRRLVELLGGEITLLSEPGKGSTFRVQIPDIIIVNEGKPGQKEKIFDIRNIHFNKASILIVDDNTENRKLLVDLLDSSPLEIFEAGNGKEALELVAKHRPDLILMDLRMPVMSGYEATTILKSQEATREIPVVALSASPKIVINGHTNKEIFDDFIMKPVIISEFAEVLKKYLTYHVSGKGAAADQRLRDKSRINLSKREKEKIRELVDILEKQYIPVYRDLLKKQVISQIGLFGKNLSELGQKAKDEDLASYGKEIFNDAENFDVEHLMEKLKIFPAIIEKLNQTLEVKI